MTPLLEPYAAIGVVVVLATIVVIGMLVAAHVIGPSRHGSVKDTPYESGMPPIGDTHRRFNIRFYVVALLFLLFDVEVVFLWPWALAFYRSAVHGDTYLMSTGAMAGKEFLLAGMGMFFAVLLFGLWYEWKKGAFRWD